MSAINSQGHQTPSEVQPLTLDAPIRWTFCVHSEKKKKRAEAERHDKLELVNGG